MPHKLPLPRAAGRAILTAMDTPASHRRFHPAPAWLVLGSLAMTGLLFASNWLGWPAWHKGYAVLTAVAGVGVVLLLLLLWFAAALVFRLRFQFSIRSLLVLTVAVALPFSWLGVEMKRAREQREAVDFINARGHVGYYDARYWQRADYYIIPYGKWDLERILESRPPTRPVSPEPAWLGRFLGKDFFCDALSVIAYESEFKDPYLVHVEGMDQLRWLELGGTQVTDAELEPLKSMHQLQSLDIAASQVTDAGLRRLRALR